MWRCTLASKADWEVKIGQSYLEQATDEGTISHWMGHFSHSGAAGEGHLLKKSQSLHRKSSLIGTIL